MDCGPDSRNLRLRDVPTLNDPRTLKRPSGCPVKPLGWAVGEAQEVQDYSKHCLWVTQVQEFPVLEWWIEWWRYHNLWTSRVKVIPPPTIGLIMSYYSPHPLY